MKILKSLLIVSLCFMMFSMTKKANCKKDFSGKWKYKEMTTEQIYVVRTLDKQTEYSDSGKYYYKFDIKWIDKCKYQVIYKGTNNPKAAVTEIDEITTIEILEIDKKNMRYKTSFRDLEEVGEMTKIQ